MLITLNIKQIIISYHLQSRTDVAVHSNTNKHRCLKNIRTSSLCAAMLLTRSYTERTPSTSIAARNLHRKHTCYVIMFNICKLWDKCKRLK